MKFAEVKVRSSEIIMKNRDARELFYVVNLLKVSSIVDRRIEGNEQF